MSDDATAAACAANLRTLASDSRFEKRAIDLNSLATDIEKPDGDSWAGLDLFAAFPTDTGAASSHPNWIERLLGIASGVAVFLPVAWTWWSFRDASRAYESMLAQGDEADGTSFLSLWATGFEGNLTGRHQLVPMAGISLSLIILAIAFLVLHRMAAEFNVRREEAAAKQARTDLVNALTQAQRIINQRRADHPQRIEGIIKSSMQKLQMAHDATRLAITDLTDSSKQITKDMTKLVKSAKEAGEESRRLTASAAEAAAALQLSADEARSAVSAAIAALESSVQSGIETTTTSLVSAGSSLDASLRGSLSEFQSSLGSQVQAFAQETTRSIGEFQSSLGSEVHGFTQETTRSIEGLDSSLGAHLDGFTGRAISALESASNQLNQSVAQIGSSSESNAASAGALTEQIRAFADDRAASADEFTRAVTAMRSTLESLEEALTSHESTMQGQASELTGARDAAERMLRVLTTSVPSQTSMTADV